MKKFEKQAIDQAIIENISAYKADYPIQKQNGGISPTEDCCLMIAQYITNEYNNNPDCEKYNKDEYIDACIEAFYEHLELSEGDFDETNSVYDFLDKEVKRYISENVENV